MCKIVTGRRDSAELLDQLYRKNLLMITHTGIAENNPENMQSSYRYHDLFIRFLREKLRQKYPEMESELHRKAAVVETTVPARMYHPLTKRRHIDGCTRICPSIPVVKPKCFSKKLS